jgi:hypothetical protein
MKRIYHPYDLWEENKYNMWGHAENKKEMLGRAIDFTGDHELYGEWMRAVVRDWKYSCENALTDMSQNRRAWIGHAAVAYAIQCPEDITRQAWGRLTKKQQDLANSEADKAIYEWENKRKNKRLYRDVGTQVLFKWNTGRD